ncbi:MAG TPA: hypothetical protein VHY32_02660 [Caulobacteraceae bacterium]|jgi:hypothetical protein|nr:hypothetical protein [Caulobacteraceae bacterium]
MTAAPDNDAPHAGSPDAGASVAAAMACLDDLMAAFNARDVEAFDATFNFPGVILASGKLVIVEPGHHRPGMFEQAALAEWDHSGWERREVIHAGADKVHVDTCFTRYRADGGVIGRFDAIYVVTLENGHWGVKARSVFAL